MISRRYNFRTTFLHLPHIPLQDFKKFVHLFLSLLFATPTEIGYDPTVHRAKYNHEICYVYEMGTEQAPRYYRTTKLLFAPSGLRVTGRKTRVWEAVEVEGRDEDKIGKVKGKPVALKDGWLEKDSRTEEKIQEAIFARLESVKKKHYGWVPKELRQILKNAFQGENYKGYFMEIVGSRKFATTKLPVPEPFISSSNPETPPSSKGTVEGPIQDKDWSELPSGHGQTSSDESQEGLPTREYRPRQQHRLIYRDVGCPLHDAKDITTSFLAIQDTCVGAHVVTDCVLVY